MCLPLALSLSQRFSPYPTFPFSLCDFPTAVACQFFSLSLIVILILILIISVRQLTNYAEFSCCTTRSGRTLVCVCYTSIQGVPLLSSLLTLTLTNLNISPFLYSKPNHNKLNESTSYIEIFCFTFKLFNFDIQT